MSCQSIEESSCITVPTMDTQALGSLSFGSVTIFKQDASNQSFLDSKELSLNHFPSKNTGPSSDNDHLSDIFGSPLNSKSAAIHHYSSSPHIFLENEKREELIGGVNHLIKAAEKVLSHFEISLSIRASKSQSKAVYDALKYLIPEICQFPTCFIKTVQIGKLTLCGEEMPSDCSLAPIDTSFLLKDLDTQAKIFQRLYEIILNRIIITNSDFVEEWEEIDQSECDTPLSREMSSSFETLKRTFFTLMMRSSYSLRKPKVKGLQELLSKHYPKMPEEWFKNRIKERKKSTRVCFSLNCQ